MAFFNKILKRPLNERPYLILVVGWLGLFGCGERFDSHSMREVALDDNNRTLDNYFLSIKAYRKISDKLEELEKCCQILYLMPYF